MYIYIFMTIKTFFNLSDMTLLSISPTPSGFLISLSKCICCFELPPQGSLSFLSFAKNSISRYPNALLSELSRHRFRYLRLAMETVPCTILTSCLQRWHWRWKQAVGWDSYRNCFLVQARSEPGLFIHDTNSTDEYMWKHWWSEFSCSIILRYKLYGSIC